MAVTDRTDLETQLRETAQLSGEAVRPTDYDVMRRESPTARTQRILGEVTPDIVFAMLQKYQEVERLNTRDRVAMTIVRKERKPGLDQQVVEKQVTVEENIHFEEFPVINESEKILVLVDEAHRSHTRALHRNLRKALPNAAIIGFTGTPILSHEKTETREIFGDFIDKYLLQDAELDGATVPILPFLALRGSLAVASSAAVSALGLFAIGAAITVFTGVSVWRSSGRQLLLGLAAAGLTFGVGRLIGIAITP